MSTNQTIGAAEYQPGVQAQQAFLLCSADRLTSLRGLADEVERQLSQAVVLAYGVSPKRHEGFLVVEAARGIPLAFVQWLKAESRILAYAVYDIPSFEQERQAIAEAKRQGDERAHGRNLEPAATDLAAVHALFLRAWHRLRSVANETQPQEAAPTNGAEWQAEQAAARKSLDGARQVSAQARQALAFEEVIGRRLSQVEQRCQQDRQSQDEDTRYMALVDITDAYEGAVRRLSSLVTAWEKMENELLDAPAISAAAEREGAPYPLTHVCLEQRIRVTQQLAQIMQRLGDAERERLAFLQAEGGQQR